MPPAERRRPPRRASTIRPTGSPTSPISRSTTPLDVAYPDADAPGVLLKLGKPVPGGVGPDGDIVGFTTICPHKGYPARLQRRRPDA